MTRTCDVTAATASTDTTEVALGTITLPNNAKRIAKVGVSCGGAGITTLEGLSGFMRISVNNHDVAPAKFPFSYGSPVTSGVMDTKIQWYDVDWPAGSAEITFYLTLDMATTVANTFRGCVLFDK